MKQFEQTLLFLLIFFDKIGKWNVNVFQGDQKREKVKAKTIFTCRWEEQVDGGQD